MIILNDILAVPSIFSMTAVVDLAQVWEQFVSGMIQTSLLEYVAVIAGIVSVWYSRKEDILVYPIGLVSTIIYVYLSFKYHLIGEASVNIYYSVLSIYGWYLWAKRNNQQEHVLHITFSTPKMWAWQLTFFAVLYCVIYFSLVYLKGAFYPGVIPWGDAFASATAYTGMWLMARKKVESWYWWIGTNVASIPLYFVKGLVFTSVFYFILLIMAFWGLVEWQRRARAAKQQTIVAM
ncbi:nicotinamide mononucleotide transporter [Pontibacter sp. BT310]|uniref:Nicotinamide riboside transporter PnuC n=1 Tax=Pontibacter populi TaxID=890055 RepID=A0ABS6X7N9_9BACT|nr:MULTISPECIES: nicotinamide riboside transporter PnuC [Pontibacter]MBJ6117145.1 nicotinamide mononucleotide transporter [Pontibacter sp. BT310]MBR0569570.1 nicotinamide mononucleotide transporter [Microvirga sp. STS03]MBW3363998.1 nicotinamide riboside transporter PnuC [Pontibacter populi]